MADQTDPMLQGARARAQANAGDGGILGALRAWMASKRGDVDAARNVDEAANAALPDVLSGREAVLRRRAALQRMDEHTRDQP